MTLPIPNTEIFLNKRTKVNAAEITLLEADVNYTKIYFEQRSPLMVAVTLKKIELLLKEHSFLRVHKKFIVGLDYADYSLLTNGYILLPGGILIKISRRKCSSVKKKLKNRK